MTAQAGSASSLSSPANAPEIASTTFEERQRLRRELRQRRRSLSSSQRAAAHRQFARILLGTHWTSQLLQAGRRVAVYFAYGHEADLEHVIALARRRRCALYLPLITDFRRSRMRFVRYDTDAAMRINRYGIAEPDPRHAAIIPARHLDVVLLPLVGFDSHGWRLGSGAGFYDRSLHHLREHRRWRRPKLIGVGYECQRVARLQPDRWDVPLDGMLTERGFQRILRR
jgi:5-formyltetrahydrofolate cyclo-ligase